MIPFLQDLKVGSFVIETGNAIYSKGYAAVICEIKDDGFGVRDECANNYYFITKDQMHRDFKLPVDEGEMTEEEVKKFGCGVCFVNYVLLRSK